MGAGHFAELWYVFDHLDQLPGRSGSIDRRLAELMAGSWVRFAATGNPERRRPSYVADLRRGTQRLNAPVRRCNKGRGRAQHPALGGV